MTFLFSAYSVSMCQKRSSPNPEIPDQIPLWDMDTAGRFHTQNLNVSFWVFWCTNLDREGRTPSTS